MLAPTRKTSNGLRMRPRRGAERAARRWIAVGWIALSACVLAGCAASGPEPEDDLALDAPRRAARIEALRASIERDQATIQDLISQPRAEDEPPIHDDPELRAIAARMSDQVQRLERLEAARDESSANGAGPARAAQ